MDAMTEAKKTLERLGRYIVDHWITVIILGVSSTQTYYLVNLFAPKYASWLPALGVGLMEGGFLYWRWREYEADPIDDGKINTNKQEFIANIMVYATLFASVVTMLAGAALEIANSDLAYILTIPNMDNLLGMFAIAFIFLLAGAHLFADWQYRKHDPDGAQERAYREQTRLLARQKREADIEGQKIVLAGRNAELKRRYSEQGAEIGRGQASAEFEELVKTANPKQGNGRN
jgi:hypothetical protein